MRVTLEGATVPEEIPPTIETPQPTESKSTDWTKIILAAVLGFGLLATAAYAGYWHGTQQTKQIGEPPSVSQPTPAPESTPSPGKLGGPCEYTSYQGACTITSIEGTAVSEQQKGITGGPRYEGFEILYHFEGRDSIPQRWQELVSREHTLQLANSWYPGPKFIERYEIEVGKKFDCTVLLITKGTCTPVIFKFENIDQTDYFETER